MLKVVPSTEMGQDCFNSTDQDTIRLSRYIPVVGSKYIDVWKRVKIKIRAQLVIKKLLQTENSKISSKTVEEESNTLMIRKASRIFTSMSDVGTSEPTPWFILHPKNRVKNIWNLILAVLLIYTVTLMPFSWLSSRAQAGTVGTF
jgi:hypothetical protein